MHYLLNRLNCTRLWLALLPCCLANEICFLHICMHESCCYACMCACVSVFVCVQALTERGRLDSLSFLTLLLAFHCCAANDASIHSPNTPFITIRPLLFLSLLISASLSVSLFLCMPHARCTKYELSLLYIFSFACQAHLRHGGAAAAAPSSAGLDCAVIRMTAKNNKKKNTKNCEKKMVKRNTNYGKWAQILMKFNNEKQIK